MSSGKLVAGADAGTATAPSADIKLGMYVDNTCDYDPSLKYDPTFVDPQGATVTHVAKCLNKFFNKDNLTKENNGATYTVKGSDLEIDVEVEEQDEEKRKSWQDMSVEDHMKFYEEVKSGVKNEAMKVDLNASNVLGLMTRLRQATVDPSILTTEKIKSTKIERCLELIHDLVDQHEKVVVFSNFKQPLETLAQSLREYNPLICTGDYTDDHVSRCVDLFQSDPNSLICLCTHARVGTGFTLNAAAYAIMLDTPYTYSSLDQSICRLYRLNNTRPCYIKILVCKDTVDERISQIVDTKRDLGDYIMDGQMSDSLQAELTEIIRAL
jgi:SNF2 family DNA or RNA helicase